MPVALITDQDDAPVAVSFTLMPSAISDLVCAAVSLLQSVYFDGETSLNWMEPPVEAERL